MGFKEDGASVLVTQMMHRLVVWNMFYLSIYWEFHHLTFIFFRGVGSTTNQCMFPASQLWMDC